MSTRSEIDAATEVLLHPAKLSSRDEALDRTSELPKSPGIYAWYFDELPPGVPTAGVHHVDGRFLQYAGISPKEPRRADGKPSSGTLRSRIRSHYRGNASQSTLRLTLGSLLHEALDIELQQTSSGRLTFGAGEAALSEWMSEHAEVCWAVHAEPWLVERAFIASVPLRLNLDQNQRTEFHAQLTKARAEQRAHARRREDENS